MKEEDLCGRAKQVEALFVPRLKALADTYPQIGDVRGRGAMLAVELVNGAGDITPNAALTAAVNKACHADGLVTLTCGTYGNVFRFLPPLAASDELLSEGLDIFEKAFAASV
jgi:4-aminobutyrate aminotransferase/(S)-3-amino-2-methylpropionate transaminase